MLDQFLDEDIKRFRRTLVGLKQSVGLMLILGVSVSEGPSLG